MSMYLWVDVMMNNVAFGDLMHGYCVEKHGGLVDYKWVLLQAQNNA